MKISSVSLCIALALGLSACSRESPTQEPAASSVDAAHEAQASHDAHDPNAAHADHAQASTVLPDGQKWPSDEPLRTAMSRIRAAVEPHATSHEPRQLTASEAGALATLVEENVAYMVANCKLDPRADAALHIVIGRMLNAAASLKKDPASPSGLPQLVGALQEYGTTFEHAGWTALTSH